MTTDDEYDCRRNFTSAPTNIRIQYATGAIQHIRYRYRASEIPNRTVVQKNSEIIGPEIVLATRPVVAEVLLARAYGGWLKLLAIQQPATKSGK